MTDDGKEWWCVGCGPVLSWDADGSIVITGFVHAVGCEPACQAREEAAAREAINRANARGAIDVERQH